MAFKPKSSYKPKEYNENLKKIYFVIGLGIGLVIVIIILIKLGVR